MAAPPSTFSVAWSPTLCDLFGIHTGDPKFQHIWEACTLLAAVIVWAQPGCTKLAGDALGALQAALSLKGRDILAHVARELAWRQQRFS